MTTETVYKDPDELLICTFDWSAKLNAGATVSGTNTWSATPTTPSPPLSFASLTIVVGGLKTSAKISGGVAGETYIVTNRVTTSDGETLEESGKLKVKESSA
jgi:hypothetical protein